MFQHDRTHAHWCDVIPCMCGATEFLPAKSMKQDTNSTARLSDFVRSEPVRRDEDGCIISCTELLPAMLGGMRGWEAWWYDRVNGRSGSLSSSESEMTGTRFAELIRLEIKIGRMWRAPEQKASDNPASTLQDFLESDFIKSDWIRIETTPEDHARTRQRRR
jgi:hypothetical protein